MANTTIKISQLPSIGNGLTGSTILPVVSLTGAATTNKVAVGNIANFTLIQAGNTLPPASVATIAYSVANAAQPNITSVGTLSISTLKISGGTSGYVLQTDGTGNLTWTAQTGGGGNTSPAGSNTQIQFNNQGSFGANANLRWDNTTRTLFAPNINANIVSSSSNLTVNGWEFTNGGRLIWPSVSGTSFYIDTNGDNEFEIKSLSNVVISSDITNVNSRFTFASSGVFYAPSNVELQGTRLSIGPDAANFVLESPTVVIGASSNVFVQAALTNQNANGSADWVAYGAEGDDTGGWTDFGFTGHNFNDANYTITGPGDGYVFAHGYANGIGGGNLVVATGDHGTHNDIIFATGGFAVINEFARISNANNSLELTRAGSSITFPDNTTQTTAYTGTGNVTFDDVAVQGAGAQLLLSPDPTFTANLSYVQIRAGDVASHIHVDTGNNNAYDLIIGNDQKFVQVSSTGNIIMSSYDNATTPYRMTLDYNGELTIPGDIQSITTGFSFTSNISNVDTTTIANTVIVTLVDSGVFPAPVTGQVTITDVVGTTEANGTWYFEAVEANQFQLYYDVELNYPVDGAGWPAYVSGGIAVALGYNDLGITGGNVSITNNTGHNWTFAKGGGTIYPTLNVTRGDRTGTLTGQTLLFGDSTQEAIISTPNGTNVINASQRFVINPGAGAVGTTGEGGDIYLYAGRGGDAGGSGGDIKIRGGLAPADGTGGYLDIQGGDTQGNGTGGYIDIRGGQSGSAIGGAINLYGGYGPTVGGNVTITGGVSGNGLSNYGNVSISSGALTWTFDNTGTLTVPGNLVAISASPAPIISGFSSVSALQFTNGTGNVTVNANSYLWNFDSTGNLTLPGNTVSINFANGSVAFGNLVQWTTAPIANTSAGTAGQAAYDSGGNLYVCVLTNTWAKFSGTTSW